MSPSIHARIEPKFRKIWVILLSTSQLATGRYWCPRPESNRHALRMVADFESEVSTIFITRAGGPACRESHTAPVDDEPTESRTTSGIEAQSASRILPRQDRHSPMLKGSERPRKAIRWREKSKLRLSARHQLAAVSLAKVEHCFASSQVFRHAAVEGQRIFAPSGLMQPVGAGDSSDCTLIAFCFGAPGRTGIDIRQLNGKVRR